ncbi:unnamed protein product, partial [Didymodactylos carnosus]
AHKDDLTQEWCKNNMPNFIDRPHWPANSPDLNPLDYSIWDEFVQQMNSDKIKSKTSLMEELKRAVKRIRIEIVLESCAS